MEEEIRLEDLDPRRFIEDQILGIQKQVEDGLAINTLSGGVDSSTVTLLGHHALAERLLTFSIDNGLMRQREPQNVASFFKDLGIKVEIIEVQKLFFDALAGIVDPEEKRRTITSTFYRDVFGPLVRETGARYLFQGTNFTDVEEAQAGIKRQHNVLAQIGIDPEETYGYKIIEPLARLRKPAVRKVAKVLGLPEEIYERPPFPGPALAIRVVGEVTPERIELVRRATAIVEEELVNSRAFQYFPVLHADMFTGIKDSKRVFGHQIELRSWESRDGRTGSPSYLPWDVLQRLEQRITFELPEVVSVTYSITPKPPSTIEPG